MHLMLKCTMDLDATPSIGRHVSNSLGKNAVVGTAESASHSITPLQQHPWPSQRPWSRDLFSAQDNR
jgi:hypothetical protein